LIEHGANVREVEDYSLRYASRNGHNDIVKLLLLHGANVHAFDDESLLYSRINRHVEIFKILLDNGANIFARDYMILDVIFGGYFVNGCPLITEHVMNHLRDPRTCTKDNLNTARVPREILKELCAY
jgi:ankyrin repeat protein